MAGEFDFIARNFRPLAGPGAFELRNDGAVLSSLPGEEFAISTDTMVEGVHFLPNDPPGTIGRKLLRCNLSDLAAMGAKPHAYTLNVTIPRNGRYSESWFDAFSQGLAADQDQYRIFLLGGDTTSIDGPLVLSATVYGRLKIGTALHRNSAKPGDGVWVTGTIGDAALGLQVLQGKLHDETGFLANRYHLPQPRTGVPLYGLVSTAMDISDGLIQDCGHIAQESGVSLHINAANIPLSTAAQQLGESVQALCMSGGDDYELLMTCPPQNESALVEAFRLHGIMISRIGEVVPGSQVRVIDAHGHDIILDKIGWQHF